MTRLRTLAAAAAVAAVALSACTPDSLLAWIAAEEAAASQAGAPCPIYADDLAWRGLPDHFLTVIERESMCQPDAINSSSGALGLTQIMPSWIPTMCARGIACTEADLLNPQVNLDAAAVIWAVQGAGAWSQTW